MSSDNGGSIPEKRPDLASATEYRVPRNLSWLPAKWVPYAELMRLDRPAGFFAFYWHYVFGLAFAASVAPVKLPVSALLHYAIYLVLWVTVLRGTVCTVNDIFDQEFDRQVARTRQRPVARGAVSSAQGWTFVVVQVVVGVGLSMPLPKAAMIWGALMAAALSVYPLAKRISNFPQVVLGFGLAMPIFFCCAVLETDSFLQSDLTLRHGHGQLNWAELCLYGAGVLWTILFDTIYAHQDIADDKKAGVKSLAIRLEGFSKEAFIILACFQVILLFVAGNQGGLSSVYYLVGCGGAAASLLAMIVFVDLKTPASCAWWFGPGSRFVGSSVALGLLAEYMRR